MFAISGALMGWFGMMGSLGRICLPSIAGFTSTEVTFVVCAVIAGLSIALIIGFAKLVNDYRKSKPIELDDVDDHI